MPLKYRMPRVDSDFFPFQGGLDLVTPAISMPQGRVFDSKNYEPAISGGYRRVDGYERFDGRPSPTDGAKYVVVPANLADSAVIDLGISSPTVSGRVVGIFPQSDNTDIVVSGVDESTQTFLAGEKLTLSNGKSIGYVAENSSKAEMPADDALYQLLAANDIRRDIGPVPGAGPIRGVFALSDTVYAFRDDPGSATQSLYRSSPAGWEQVILGQELLFNSGVVEIKAGDTVTSSAGLSHFVAGVVTTRKGTWATGGNEATGSIVIVYNSMVGSFAIGDGLYVNGVQCATVTMAPTNIVRQGGATQKMELVKYSFGKKTGPQVIYGVDGKNLAFEFNGSDFIPIRTMDPGSADAPNHVAAHLNYLFLAYGTNMQWSTVYAPYTWDGVLGAAEASAGAVITAMVPLVGGNQAPAMAVLTQEKVAMLYGSGASTFRLQNTVTEIGYSSGTVQPISGSALGLTARGLQSITATQAFGDFAFTAASLLVQPIINKLRGKEQCSVVLKNKNQYRIFYDDGEGACLACELNGDKVKAILPLKYGIPVRCIWTETFSDGKERTFFGSDDGYVYEDNKGTSFDGGSIEFWIRTCFNHVSSPRLRKRWRRATIEASVDSYCEVNFTYDLGYGNPEVDTPELSPDAALAGGVGGYYEQFTYDQFIWDSQVVISPSISIEGTEKTISLVFYGNRAQDKSHTIQGVTIDYTKRRGERS